MVDAFQLSVVVPIYNEEGSIDRLYEELTSCLAELGMEYEIIFINDGSEDASEERLETLAKSDTRLRVLSFGRNSGQTAAINAGFQAARGKTIIAMDGDLQNDPKDIPRLLAKIEEGYDVVSGWRKERKDNQMARIIPSRVANWLIGRVTGVRLHDYGCSLKAYRASVVKQVKLYGEMHRFIPALASHYGAKIVEIPVNHRPRISGASKYTISRTFRVILDLLTVKFLLQFSVRPLHLFGMPGLLSFFIGFTLTCYLTVLKLFFHQDIGHRPLLLLAVLLILTGIQLLSLGLLAELLSRTYHEAAGKKTFWVRREVRQGKVYDHD